MRKPTLVLTDTTADPVYLMAAAISSLIQTLPSGTAYCIGIVLIVMVTGRLMQHKGSLARASLPLVLHLQWGWHRVERAMERGKFALDALFDHAYQWCLSHLEVEPVRLGCQQRAVTAVDSSTIARLRCQAGKAALLGKGYCHRAGRAVRANIVAAAVSVVVMRGVRIGLVRRVRFGDRSEAAVAKLFAALPKSETARLIMVDAGIATKEQFAASTVQDALLGRLRHNSKLRCAPPPPNGKRGRDPLHGPVLHPGGSRPDSSAAMEPTALGRCPRDPGGRLACRGSDLQETTAGEHDGARTSDRRVASSLSASLAGGDAVLYWLRDDGHGEAARVDRAGG